MRPFEILALVASLAPFATAQCTTRSTDCSPRSVCDQLSGLNVCGTRETSSNCGKTINGDSGSMTCTCCKV
ncbi:hypothetical protein F53441_11911 [Fusarium austroafricanum]|uniref:Uncharacterized protein n=1 Tax=Fusarium austroafricanum TaxID=2364996 RepID=A0A8H4NRS0_9HYPO|nr:hypothetical protein F53441_11911 [Fusarium austroafricanum]